jgi:hypothetical protein
MRHSNFRLITCPYCRLLGAATYERRFIAGLPRKCNIRCGQSQESAYSTNRSTRCITRPPHKIVHSGNGYLHSLDIIPPVRKIRVLMILDEIPSRSPRSSYLVQLANCGISLVFYSHVHLILCKPEYGLRS